MQILYLCVGAAIIVLILDIYITVKKIKRKNEERDDRKAIRKELEELRKLKEKEN